MNLLVSIRMIYQHGRFALMGEGCREGEAGSTFMGISKIKPYHKQAILFLVQAYSHHVCIHIPFYSDSSYWSLRVSVTNCHKCGSLTQQKFILSEFWKPEV